MYRNSRITLFLMLLGTLSLLACAPSTTSVGDRERIEPSLSEQNEKERKQDQGEERIADEEPRPEESSSRHSLEVELPPLRDSLRSASSWEELESIVAQIAEVLEKGASELEDQELIRLEARIIAEINTRIEALPGRENLAHGESCFSQSQCASGVCGGRGCLPGQWRCTTRPGRDEPHTDDMRRACLCNGVNFQGSSTSLQGMRVRHRNKLCSESAPTF